jgi:ribosomal protein S12 methylthiotransferase accessory factor
MGYCYYKLKEHEKAIDCFRRVLELNPASAIDYANIGSNYREMGDREKAGSYYRLALELDPTIDFARENLEKLENIENGGLE